MQLQKGDTIAIISTARKVSREDLQPAIDKLTSWGLKVVLGKNALASDHQFAGTDRQRMEDLQWALDHPDIKAILCSRGGYGTIRLMDKIHLDEFQKYPKWLIGYSDITVLHAYIQSHCQIPTIHGTVALNFPADGFDCLSTNTLHQILFGKKPNYVIEPHSLNRKGEGKGILAGGNLSILYSINGTPSDLDTDGKILFIEDLDEYLYHIDRMMQNLKLSGKLSKLKGLIVGGMTDMHDNTIPFGKTAEQIIFEAVSDYDYPVCFGFPAGHLGQNNAALILGSPVEFIVKEEVTLNFL